LPFFNKITHFYAYFDQNSYFKAITHQLKAFKISLKVINRIKYKFYSIRINVTKYDVITFLPQPPLPPPVTTPLTHTILDIVHKA